MSKRIQFEFAPDAIARMEMIKRNTGRQSYAHIVRDAVRLFEWFIAQENAGYTIGLVRDDLLVKTVKFHF